MYEIPGVKHWTQIWVHLYGHQP